MSTGGPDPDPTGPAGPADVLAGLDPDQLAAVTAPAGPVCVLAGAGTGKTRAITHRIAHRARSGQIRPQHVLAVTFTARAAGELRDRLRALGVPGVPARTFHSAALRMLRYFAPRVLSGRELPEVVANKTKLIRQVTGRVRLRLDDALGRDLATEIEWAKASLVEPADYPAAAARAGRQPPVPPEQLVPIYQEYERVKSTAGVIDFEDLLRSAVWAVEDHPDVAEQVRAQYRHFVVDEYQDVNPVQQRLLDAWLGGRDDLTVVGDVSQTIYSFTGASAAHLIDFPRRYPGAVVVRLVRDYRSTPQVVGLANQVIRAARGAEARLRLELHGQRPDGPAPRIRSFPDEPAEAAAVAARCVELIAAGTPAREIAVLFRANAQSEAYEEALADAGVPYTVQGAARFFERPEVRRAMVAVRAATRTVRPGTPLPAAVTEALAAVGWAPDNAPAGGAVRERWEALAALVRLATEYAGAAGTGADALVDFHAELVRRAAAQHVPAVDGVTLASLHAAKGLEWDAVFLVGLAEGTLPVGYARGPAQLEEERRLLYVGITRARQWLWLSWPAARSPGGPSRQPCRFLPAGAGSAADRPRTTTPGLDPDSGPDSGPGPRRGERPTIRSCRVCGATLLEAVDRILGRCADCPADLDQELFERLRGWRDRTAGAQGLPPYIILTDVTLTALAEQRPGTEEQLIEMGVLGPHKLRRYGPVVLALVAGAEPGETPVARSGSAG